MAEWDNLKIAQPINEMAKRIVEISPEGYRNVGELVTDLIRQKHREIQADTVKNAISSPTAKGPEAQPDYTIRLDSFGRGYSTAVFDGEPAEASP